MKFFTNTCLILILFSLSILYTNNINAQEQSDESTNQMDSTDEIFEGSEPETTENPDGLADEEKMDEMETEPDVDNLSEEEIEEILENTEVLTDDMLDSLEDLEGEIIAVTDNEVIIKTDSGEIIVVPYETYEQRRGSGGGQKAKVGEKIETLSLVSVLKEGNDWIVTTSKGSFTLPGNIPVIHNGKVLNIDKLGALDEDAKIVVFTDKDRNILALEIIGELDKVSNTLIKGTLIAIIIIIILGLLFRKKKNKFKFEGQE